MAAQLTAPPKEFFRQFANLAHNRLLTEDFPHDKLLTLKYKGTGSAFVVNAKGSLNIKTTCTKTEVTKEDGKKEVVEVHSDTYPNSYEVKFLTNYSNTTTEARFSSKGHAKVHTNWGVHKLGEPVEIVSVVKGTTDFKKTKAWVGAYYAKGSIGVGTRVQVRRTKGFAFSLAEKITYSHKDLWAGAYVDVNLSELKLSQYNAIVGYNVNKNIHFYAEHITSKECCDDKKKATPAAVTATPAATTGGATTGAATGATETKVVETVTTTTEKSTVVDNASGAKKTETTVTVEAKKEVKDNTPLLKKIGFGKGALTGVYKDANIFALAQVAWEEPTETFSFEAGAAYTINGNSSVRAKINQNLDLAVGGRHKINKNISLNVGTSIPLGNPEKFYNAHNTVPIPFGATLEFNF